MNKITFSNTTLTCTFQKSEELQESQCLVGAFSKSHLKTMDKGFDKRTFAEKVYQEIVNALKIID